MDNPNRKFVLKDSQRVCQGSILALLCSVSNIFMRAHRGLQAWRKTLCGFLSELVRVAVRFRSMLKGPPWNMAPSAPTAVYDFTKNEAS